MVSDSGRAKSAELSPRAKMECIDKGGARLWWGQEYRTEPTGNEGVHRQLEGQDFGGGRVDS